MPRRPTEDPSPGQDEEAAATARDPAPILGELARRWRGAYGLEYRSLAVMNHAGEFRVNVRIHAWLRRPSQARLVFRSKDIPEADRLRVCDGVRVWDRLFGHPGETGRTLVVPLPGPGRITDNISHPLDETGYSVTQFFSSTPFTPPSYWNAQPGPLRTMARRLSQWRLGGENAAPRDVFEVVFTKGVAKDTLTLDALSYAPLLLVRISDHGGRVQETLRETFLDVRLNPPLADSLFRWSRRDEAGLSETPA